MAERAYFKIFHDKLELLEDLTDEECGKLLRMLGAYSQYGEVPELSAGSLRMAFRSFKAPIDIGIEKWEKQCETNRANGAKGGRPKKKPVGYEETEKNPMGFSESQQNQYHTTPYHSIPSQEDTTPFQEESIPIHEQEEEEERERRGKPPDNFKGVLLNFQRRNNKQMPDSLLQACVDSGKSNSELNTIIDECSGFRNVEDLILSRLATQPF